MFPEFTIACIHNERSDWTIERYPRAEAQNNFWLDRAVMKGRGKLDQTYTYWVIITKLAESNALLSYSDQAIHAIGETPGNNGR